MWAELARHAAEADPVIVIDTYPGVDLPELETTVRNALPEYSVINVEAEAAKAPDAIDQLIAGDLTDDRVFGILSHHSLSEFYDADRLMALADRVRSSGSPTVLIGWGAALVPVDASTSVLADLARWEIQQRQRAGELGNLGADNAGERASLLYKRAFFLDWRAADRLKSTLLERIDFFLDTTKPTPLLVAGDAVRRGLGELVSRPFRVVPL